MAHEHAPAFQFYPKDFLTDGNVAAMSLEERGAYITLLCLCWQECSLPSDTKRLAVMVGTTWKVFQRVWPAIAPCFVEQEGRLVQKRLEKERAKQVDYRRRQSDAGKASAAARQPNGNRGSTSVATNVQPEVNSSSSSSSPYSEVPTELLRRRGRGKPPLNLQLKRLKFWQWMADAFIGQLGAYAEDFNLDDWIRERDEAETRVITGDWWEYWRPAFEAEVRKRGLPIAATSTARRLIETTPEEDGAALQVLLAKDRAR